MDRLLSAIKKPPENTIVVNESKALHAVAALGASLLLIGYVFTEANGYKWHAQEAVTYSSLVAISFTVGCISSVYIARWMRANIRPCVLINPLYFVRVRFEQIEILFPYTWNVKHNSDSRGRYTSSNFGFYADTSTKRLKIGSLRQANELVRSLNGFPALLSDLVQRKDDSHLYGLDLLAEWRLREQQFPRARSPRLTGLSFVLHRLGPTVLAGAVGIAIFILGMMPYNNYRDDELRWHTAQSTATATGYRLYVASRPDGNHVAEAHAEIENLYDRTTQNYRASLGAEPSQGIEAVIRMLEYAKRTGRYKVFVIFVADNEIPPDIEERLRALHGVSNMVPISPSFSPSLNQARQDRILERISTSFAKVIPGDILQFAVGQPNADDITFAVRYIITASGDLYYPEEQDRYSETKRDWYTGIKFDWDFRVRVPDESASSFELNLVSEPSQHFQVAYTRTVDQNTGTTAVEVYGAMADSAFDDFGSKLLASMVPVASLPPSQAF